MRILILTSKDHPYANLLLGKIVRSGLLSGHDVLVWEQDAIVPGRGKFAGLYCYIRTAGVYYVGMQVLKQILFYAVRSIAAITHNKESPWYPYWLRSHGGVRRQTVNHIKSDVVYHAVRLFHPDILLSIYSKEIVPKRIFSIPGLGAYNLHPALLPRYRGVSPVFWSLANGERGVGATLHILDSGIDTGTIIASRRVSVTPSLTEHDVYVRCTVAGTMLVRSLLRRLLGGKALPAVMRRRLRATDTYYSLPTREAVTRLLRHGYRLFRWQEFWGITL